MWVKKLKNNKIISSIFSEFVYGGHLLSLSDASIVLAITILFDKPISLPLLVITYLMPQIVYLFDHIKELKDDKETNPERVSHMEKMKKAYPVLLVIYLVLLFSLLLVYANVNTLILVIVIGLGGIYYPKNLTKKIVGFKNYYVGVLSAFALCFLPFFYYGLTLNSLFILFSLFAFSRLFLNTIYFDIKDQKSDKDKGLKTIVVTMGLDKTIVLLSVINVLSSVIIVGLILFYDAPVYIVGMLFVTAYSFIYLLLTKKLKGYQLRRISYLMVDGEYLLWPILLIISKDIYK